MYCLPEEAPVGNLGKEQELNTQQCLELQRELLSSSPLHVTQNNAGIPYEKYSQLETESEVEDDLQEKRVYISNVTSHDEAQFSEPISKIIIDHITIRDSENKTKLPVVKGIDSSTHWKSPINTDDFTQKSSMSLTQENPITAYSHLFPIKPNFQARSFLTEIENSLGSTRESSHHESQITSEKDINSIAPSYQVNDTCDMNLDLEQETRENRDSDSLSLDTPRAIDQVRKPGGSLQKYEPRTPANPFKERGSLMPKIDLFAATQPSSINHHDASPTSSRPSPETYGGYSSPIKRQKTAVSPIYEYTNGMTKVDSSKNMVAQYLLRNQQLIRTPVSKVQSFDVLLNNVESSSAHKLRSYISMNESQERRISGLQFPMSEDSDSSQETLSKPLHKTRGYKKVSKELLQKSPVNLELLSSKSSKIDISPVINCHTDQEGYGSQLKKSNLIDKEKEEISLPSNSYQKDENFIQNPINIDVENINKISETSFRTKILTRGIENQYLVPLSCSDEPQLPKLDEKLDQTSTPKEVFRNSSSQVLLRKNHLYSDLMETIPETSPLTYQTLPVDEFATAHHTGNINSKTHEITGFTKDKEIVTETKNYSSSSCKKNEFLTKASPRPKTLSIPNSEFHLKPSKNLESMVTSAVVHTAPEANISRLTDNNSTNHDFNFPLNDTHIFLGKNPKKNSKTNQHVNLKENLNEIINNEKSIGELQKTNNENDREKVSNFNRGSESEKLMVISSKMISKTPEIQSNITSSNISLSTSEIGSRLDLPEALSADAPTTICGDLVSFLQPLNDSTLKKRVYTSKGRSTTRKPKSSSTNSLVSSVSNKRKVSRKSVEATAVVTAPSTRSSRRQSLAHTTEEDSEDPLSTVISPALQTLPRLGLFNNMVFTVSYVKNEKEKKNVIQLILENGGLLLDHGFDPLFEPISQSDPAEYESSSLSLSALGKSLSFAGVIADDHSRKTKYVQALALGLPCISGRWIQSCVSKNSILDWLPYLLCAGQSSVLGNACRSRTLQPYSAIDAEFSNTFVTRKKILEGKSVLLTMGRGKSQQKRKTFDFLTRALGPTRLGHVTDITAAQKILTDDEAKGIHKWDILHVHDNEKNRGLDNIGAGRKRKLADCDGTFWPNFSKVRIITDETMIQSLIFGELIEEFH
ncbi:DNA repair protein crb2 [Erysiphe necator]|nr:DNA repair protein crb2 [Erysiphe necator]